MLGLSTSGFSNARPSLATVLPDHLKNRCLDHVMIWRRGEMEQYVDGNPVKLYGRNLQDQIDPWYAFINSDAPISEKREVAKALIRRGIDTYGVMLSAADEGISYLPSDGGHQRGRLIQPVVAGHLLGDTTMRDYVRTTFTVNDTASTSPAEYANAIYVTPAVVDETQTGGWDGSGNGTSYPYEDAHATSPATPEWQASIDGVANGLNNVWQDQAGDLTSYYRIVGNQEVASGQTAALLVMGLRAIFDHEAFFDYAARHHALQHYGDDPWRYVNGNSTARYSLITRAPPVTAANDFRREFYDTHIFQSATYYEFPAGVNDFSGVT